MEVSSNFTDVLPCLFLSGYLLVVFRSGLFIAMVWYQYIIAKFMIYIDL